MTTLHQRLPSAGVAREALRQKGQFWTPRWVAEAMVGYLLADPHVDNVFDPAVGEGAFLRATKVIAAGLVRQVSLCGTEVDPGALAQARASGLSENDLAGVALRDFVADPPTGPFGAIVANPPYLRHHRLSAPFKAQLKTFGARLIGAPLDGRAGLHVYFLLRALERLAQGGRLAFLLPADVCEGVFAPLLWRWITGTFRLDAVVTFAPEATPFPGVDTNALVVFIQKAAPAPRFRWARVTKPWTEDLERWTSSDLAQTPAATSTVFVEWRDVAEGLTTGLSRPRFVPTLGDENGGAPLAADPVLGDYARVVRGIATGANEFFFLTRARAAALGLPDKFLRPAIGRTRDMNEETAPDATITAATLDALDQKGRPTQLLSLPGRQKDELGPVVETYLAEGEAAGLPARALIAQRRPWYKMEVRAAPPFLFAYLGRRDARFLRNPAGVLPLTGFLCVYPHRTDPAGVNALWQVLRHPDTAANLARVGKSYGDGAIKVEPRALERLPLPASLVRACGLPMREREQTVLAPLFATQPCLFEKPAEYPQRAKR